MNSLPPTSHNATPQTLVIDTNIVLDLLVFDDKNARPLYELLRAQHVRWLATQPMRDELERVLDYPQIAPRMAYYEHSVASVLAHFDRLSTTVPVAPSAPYVCKDADDQKFIDLAWQEQATIISKDRAVLKLHKRLTRNQAAACTVLQFNKL